MAGQYNFGDISNFVGGDTLAGLFGDLGFSNLDGSGGMGENPWQIEGGMNEGGNIMWGGPNENALQQVKDFSFNWTPTDGQGGDLVAFDADGKQFGKYSQEDEDGFTQLMGMVAPAIASWGFGGALSGMFGGGALGGALGHGLASGSMSSMQGGKFGQGFLSGAIGGGLNGLAQGTPAVMGNNPSAYAPATPGSSLAGAAGITNPTLAGIFNRGAGSTLGALAGGASGKEALQSGLTGAAMSGVNSVGKSIMTPYMNSFNSWLGNSTPEMTSGGSMSDELDALGGNMVSDPLDQSVDPMMYSDEGARFDNSADFSYGFRPPSFLSGSGTDKSTQSMGQPSDFSLSSVFGDVGRNVGNFALNNIGDLASMLYGFYNNRRQQKALGQQAAGLQSLYGQNSPYATQLRNKLNAQAAQTGRRSNVAGRETQLQAMLADRNAQMAPTLMQLNQARGSLKNNNMNMLLQGANKMGLFSGLGNMFKNQNPYANYSMLNNTADYNTLGMEGNY